MKRKKMFLIVIGCVLAVGFCLFQNMNEKTVPVSKTWELTDEEIANIQLVGLSQDLDIKVEKAQGQTNQVVLKGNLPKSYAERLSDIAPEKDKLLISFVKSLGFSIGKLSNQLLNITVYLSEENLLEELTVKSNRGDVTIHVPEGFKRNYRLQTNNGNVTEPEVNYDVSEIITVELGYGDIKIAKD